MDRKEFLKTTGQCFCALVAGTAATSWLSGCAVSRSSAYTATVEASKVIVPLSLFTENNTQVVKVPGWQFPLFIVRQPGQQYEAILMRCTHRGYQLTAGKAGLHCNLHGSSFNLKGEVTHGPASKPLKQFPVAVKNQQLYIG